MAKKISDNDVQLILGLWSNGHSIKDIAIIFEEQENTIRYYLNKEGIDTGDEPYKITGKTYKDYLEEQDNTLRKKQARCKHVSFKCSVCSVYKDNIHDEQERVISAMISKIRYYESLLVSNNINFQ